MTDGLSTSNFNINPTAILIPPVQDQSFLSGLIGGSGISSVGGTFAALYFSSTGYSPGQIISNSTLPAGVTQTELGVTLGADVLIARNSRRCHGTNRADCRSDGGQLRLYVADLLDLYRFRHARRRPDPGNARLQRNPGLRWRPLDRWWSDACKPWHRGLARLTFLRRSAHDIPSFREHRIRSIRVLLAERRADHDHRCIHHYRWNGLVDIHSD